MPSGIPFNLSSPHDRPRPTRRKAQPHGRPGQPAAIVGRHGQGCGDRGRRPNDEGKVSSCLGSAPEFQCVGNWQASDTSGTARRHPYPRVWQICPALPELALGVKEGGGGTHWLPVSSAHNGEHVGRYAVPSMLLLAAPYVCSYRKESQNAPKNVEPMV